MRDGLAFFMLEEERIILKSVVQYRFMRPVPIPPGPNQESVWNYPRPPRIETTDKHIEIVFNQVLIVDTRRAYRLLETSHPPNYYIPLADVKADYLIPSTRTSFCEWKGQARYYTLKVGEQQATDVAWYYPDITPAYKEIEGYVSFYPGPMDACYVNGEKVQPQPGSFYAGWITQDVVGPFKGDAGSWGW